MQKRNWNKKTWEESDQARKDSFRKYSKGFFPLPHSILCLFEVSGWVWSTGAFLGSPARCIENSVQREVSCLRRVCSADRSWQAYDWFSMICSMLRTSVWACCTKPVSEACEQRKVHEWPQHLLFWDCQDEITMIDRIQWKIPSWRSLCYQATSQSIELNY